MAIVICLVVFALFGCKSKTAATIESSVVVAVDTSAVEQDSVRTITVRQDSVHIIAVQEVWENISFADSIGEVQVQKDGTIVMRGVKTLQRESRGTHSIRSGTSLASDSTAMHTRSFNGTTSRDSTSKVGTALTKTDQRYITIGKYATGVIIAIVVGAIIVFCIWWFGRKIP